ncbi:MAG: hypothetical protein QXU01_03475 [Candidatus Hadarchaeales archaeon]
MASLSNKRKIEVVADTSFLMIPGMYGVNIIDELERVTEGKFVLLVPTAVVGELERIAEKKSAKERAAARIALEIVKKWGKVIKADGPADEVIIKLAAKRAVGTGDRELRKKLRRMGIPTIFLRQRNHLEVEGYMEG